jgi:hypothetical protein
MQRHRHSAPLDLTRAQVLVAHCLAQGECALQCILNPASQTKAMCPPLNMHRGTDVAIHRFGLVSCAGESLRY